MINDPNSQINPTELGSKSGIQADSSASTPTNTKELGLFATGGALVIASAAAGIGILPVAIVGGVVGVAVYGVKKALFDSPAPADPTQYSAAETITSTISDVASQTANTISTWTGQASAWMSQKVKGSAESDNHNSVPKQT